MSVPNSRICRTIVQLHRPRSRALVVVDGGTNPHALSYLLFPFVVVNCRIPLIHVPFFLGTEVRRLVDELIGARGFRIGVELYAAIFDEIDRSA